MKPVTVTVSSQTTSAAVPLNHLINPFNVGIGCVVSGGGSLTYKIQHTFDGTNWFDHASLVTQTGNADGNYAFPVLQVRVNVTVWASGNVTVTFIQAGI
jgi:hypothetical protein